MQIIYFKKRPFVIDDIATPHQLRTCYNRGKILQCKRFGTKVFTILGFHFTTANMRKNHYKLDNNNESWKVLDSNLFDRIKLVLTRQARYIY